MQVTYDERGELGTCYTNTALEVKQCLELAYCNYFKYRSFLKPVHSKQQTTASVHSPAKIN